MGGVGAADANGRETSCRRKGPQSEPRCERLQLESCGRRRRQLEPLGARGLRFERRSKRLAVGVAIQEACRWSRSPRGLPLESQSKRLAVGVAVQQAAGGSAGGGRSKRLAVGVAPQEIAVGVTAQQAATVRAAPQEACGWSRSPRGVRLESRVEAQAAAAAPLRGHLIELALRLVRVDREELVLARPAST
eukprot:2883692-Prymnesium_polylepis.2